MGGEAGRPLTDIHGRLEITGSASGNGDIWNTLTVDDHDSTVGWQDIRITDHEVTGMGLDGIIYSNIRTLRIQPGTGDDLIFLDSLSTNRYTGGCTYLSNIGTNDMILQSTVPLADNWRVNDRVPMSIENLPAELTVTEGGTPALNGIRVRRYSVAADDVWASVGETRLTSRESDISSIYAWTGTSSVSGEVVFYTRDPYDITLGTCFQVKVVNVAPTVSASAVFNEDFTAADLIGSFSDPGQALGEQYSVTWQVYYRDTNVLVASAETEIFHFVPPTYDRMYRAVFTVTDDEGASGSATLERALAMMVRNTAPVAEAGTGYQVGEGGTVALDGTGSYDAQQSTDSLVYAWDLDGDGTFGETGADALRGDETGMYPVFSAAFLDGPGVWTVALQVTDDFGATAEDTAEIAILNVAPDAAITGSPAESPEGTEINLTGTVVDPGSSDTFTYAWQVTKNGNSFAAGSNASFSFTPDDNGSYGVSLVVTDDDGSVGTDSETITVLNVAPMATIDSMVQPDAMLILPVVHTLTFTGSFTDPGWLDTHTVSWDFGDGTVEAGAVSEEHEHSDATGQSIIDHVYAEPGTYTVTMTVLDDDGGAGASGTWVVEVLSAERGIQALDEYIQSLSRDALGKNDTQRKNALHNKLEETIQLIESGNYTSAMNKLVNDIRAKADGTVDGKPNDDWIISSMVQLEICSIVDDLIGYLMAL